MAIWAKSLVTLGIPCVVRIAIRWVGYGWTGPRNRYMSRVLSGEDDHDEAAVLTSLNGYAANAK